MAAIFVIKIFDLSSLMEKDSSVRPKELYKDTRRCCQIKADYEVRGMRENEFGVAGSTHKNNK